VVNVSYFAFSSRRLERGDVGGRRHPIPPGDEAARTTAGGGGLMPGSGYLMHLSRKE
jgi:hypothetical protein